MMYKDFRDNIKTGDVLVWSQIKLKNWRDLLAWIVRIFTISTYNHTALAWVYKGRVFAVEAVIPCVKITPLSTMGNFYHISTGCISDDAEFKLLSLVGKEYSILQAIQAYYRKPDVDDNYICTELVNDVLEIDGIYLKDVYTPDKQVFELLKRYEKIEYIENK